MRYALLLLAVPLSFARGQMIGGMNGNLISVTGDAEVKVPPDRVLLAVGVETRNRDLAAAKSKNDADVQRVLEVTHKFKIDSGDVQTDFFHVDIHYNSTVQTIVDHYEVQKAVAITLRDVSQFEDLLSELLAAGANHIYSVEFYTSELRKHRDQARALAIRAAQEKAQDMASAAGLKIAGKPQGISSYSYGGGSWYGRYGPHGGRGGMMAQNVVQIAGGAPAAEGTVALGRISVTASVTMSFRVE